MAQPTLLQDDFSGGMKPDFASDQIPKNAVRNIKDFLPGISEAPLSTRGTWNRTGATMGTTYAVGVGVAPFANGFQVVGISDTGGLYSVSPTGFGSNTSRGTVPTAIQAPVFYRNVLYIPSDGIADVSQYGGIANATAATGSPPKGQLCCVYKDHLVLANNGAERNRIWFSNAGDATSWDTAIDGQWLDASYPVNGLAVVRNMILVFSEQGVERVRGDIIPGVAGSDMVREPLPIPGCADPTSIAVDQDLCVYANAAGIFMTDGLTSVDLTEQCGIKLWYGEKMFGYDSGWVINGGIFEGKYVFSAANFYDNSTRFAGVIDIKKRSFFEVSNLPSMMFASSPLGLAQTYPGALWMAERDAPWVVRASDMFRRQSDAGDRFSIGQDIDDNNVALSPRLRTKFFRAASGRKRFKRLYFTYSMNLTSATSIGVRVYPDAALDSDQDYAIGTLTGGTATAFVTEARKKLSVSKAQEGLSVDIDGTTVAPGLVLQLRKIEAEVLPSESSR